MGPYLRIFYFLLLIILLGCSDELEPVSENVSDEALDLIDNEASNIDGLRCLLISKDGQLIFEEYFQPYNPDSLEQVRSVTKSIMGILIGIAIDKGFIEDTEIKIFEYLRNEEGFDSMHTNIALHHLLTMSGGFQWDESNVEEFNNWVLSDNRISYLLQRELSNEPGSIFNYNSAESHLLSVILQEATGISSREFADQYLFEPLSIGVRWQRLDNYTNGASGLRFKPIDLIKLGQMLVDNGKINDLSILSNDWISTSFSPHIPTNQIPEFYGYQWWIHPEIEELHGMAIGYGGQYIVVIPGLKSVIVTTADYKEIGQEKALDQSRQIYSLIWNGIYPHLKAH